MGLRLSGSYNGEGCQSVHGSWELARLTVSVTGRWAGVDNAWEQYKPKARKMLVNRAESHRSGARFVGRLLLRNYHNLVNLR